MKDKECAACGQKLESWAQYHTHECCLLYKLNEYRQSLGKPPIQIDIETEDKIPYPE